MISALKNTLLTYPGSIRPVGGDLDFYTFLKAVPSDLPILAWGGRQSRYACIALDIEERPADEVHAAVLRPQSLSPLAGAQSHEPQPFLGGWVGLNSYDDYVPPINAPSLNRLFWVNRVLIFDQQKSQIYEACLHPLQASPYQLGWRDIAEIAIKNQPSEDSPPHIWQWQAQQSPHDYHAIAQSCLADIRRGRYYQINLLRYFKLISQPDFSDWVTRWANFSGPFSSLVRLPDCEVYSFSPERFICITPGQDGLEVLTEPIKGTMPVYQDEERNRISREQLANSLKDHAELHMIVDLLRNDLYGICQPGSVQVQNPGVIHSFANVHHLIARITGRLQSDLTLGKLLQSICPGGSITGVPKIEVIGAIRSYEKRNRGYMMGNFFVWSPYQAYFDSSILIRTAQRLGCGPMEFAAGSGLVIRSDPMRELAEIQAKCRVVMDLDEY